MKYAQTSPRIFLSAGEASGDHYGALLIAALRARLTASNPSQQASQHPSQPEFFGLGGLEMEAAGFRRVVKAEDVAHMGITEILRHIPRVYGEYRKLVASIKREKPDVAVLIDFPDVNLRLARELKALNIPVIYFVSPQLWAWKKGRIDAVRQRVAKMMVIFPFEQAFYRSQGVDAEFVGHPLAELPLPAISREEYAAAHGLNPAKQWIALLPGSREKEVKLNLPSMLEAAALLGRQYEFLLPVASTLRTEAVKAVIHQASPSTEALLPNSHLVDDARAALLHAYASVVASGTATVQAALIGNPFLVVYRVSGLTYRLAKGMVSYPAEINAEPDQYGNLPIAMVNLISSAILGRRAVPELLQQEFNPSSIVSHLRPLLVEESIRATMRSDLAAVRAALQSPASAAEPCSAGFHAIERVCSEVLRQLGQDQHSGEAHCV